MKTGAEHGPVPLAGTSVLKLDLPGTTLSALETQPPNHILLKQPSSVRKETDILVEIV